MSENPNPADEIWNRAAMDAGGPNPGAGDKALSALLKAHGMACNGGVLHAVEVLDSEKMLAAISGFRYYGLNEAAAILEEAQAAATRDDIREGRVDDELERRLDNAYGSVIPSDDVLVEHFAEKLRETPADFRPL